MRGFWGDGDEFDEDDLGEEFSDEEKSQIEQQKHIAKRRHQVEAKKGSMEIEKKKCMTPKFRVSYPAVFEPKAFKDQKAKYSVVCLFPKTTDLKDLKRAAMNAAVEKWGSKEKWPKNLRLPFRDGDEERGDTPGYENHIFVTASSKQRPGVVDGQRNPLLTEDDFYAGCYARATLIAFAYDQMGNKGVSFSLQNIQKMGDGERFGGRRKAEDEFEVIDDGSDNEESYDSNSMEF